jgi:energy-coupling factor transport system permease protein
MYIVLIFVAKNFYALLTCAAVFVVVAVCSGVPIKTLLRSTKTILFLLIFTALINLFFYDGETVLFSFWIITITKEAVIHTVFLGTRLILLVLGSALLTLTTTPVALTDGIESLFSPLKIIHFPAHELALVMSIALRFIPILTDETTRIMNAQKARGADFETGSLFSRVKAVVPILIPLLIGAFRRADELGDAMDARCYSGSKVRTKYKKLQLGKRDVVVICFAVLFLTASILMRIFLPVII